MKAEAKLPHVVTPKGLTSLRTPEFLTQDTTDQDYSGIRHRILTLSSADGTDVVVCGLASPGTRTT